MAEGKWRDRVLESTRWRVVALLRRSAGTVGDLARALELTDNAVRLHLAALERDGLVEAHGKRREWTGKPAVVYRTTAGAETLYPKPYDLVLWELLRVLEERDGAADVEAVLKAVGARLGEAAASRHAELRGRADHAAAVLTKLGGLVEVEEDPGGFLLQGYSCPLAALTPGCPAACLLAESLVSGLVGAAVTERCDRTDRPRCAFRVEAA
ncbi:MAG: ArsR family transcriptional regulator [Gemmatimonadota bacterium]